MAHKNDYSIIAFFPNRTPLKWQFVHSLKSVEKSLNEKHPDWLYMNVYDRRTRQYLKRFYKGNDIPDFL